MGALPGIIGKKIGMTQIFGAAGELIPVTVVEAPPCTVVQIRTNERDGYQAVQIGVGKRRAKRVNKPRKGHHAKAGREDFESLHEFRVDDVSAYTVGQEVKLTEVLGPGDVVDVTGCSKGKGFQGVMRRHGFAGHKATHGTHESFRGPGSVGAHSFPGRIWKGKRMAGHLGNRRTTVQNLRVVAVRADEDLVLVRGGIPGARGCDVVIRAAVKGK